MNISLRDQESHNFRLVSNGFGAKPTLPLKPGYAASLNSFRCAQCDGDHHSLSSNCEKAVEYRTALKEQVNSAISGGKLQCFVPQDHPKSEQYYYTQKEFPSLPTLPSHATP